MKFINSLNIKRENKVAITALIYLSPVLLHILVFKLYPVLLSLTESMYHASFLDPDHPKFVWFKNYLDLMSDEAFWNSVWVTIKLNLFINPIQIFIAFIMAMIINYKFMGQRFYRLMFFVPLGVSVSVAVIYWGIILRPDNGPLNMILMWLGFDKQPFYASTSQATWIIILIASWKGCSFWMLFLYAGLKNIPQSVIEVAIIDGISPWRRFWGIVVPLMKRPLIFVLVADTTANFLLFTPIYMLTNGGPDDSTNVLIFSAYNTGMLEGDMGHATAINTILLLMLAAILGIQLWLTREKK